MVRGGWAWGGGRGVGYRGGHERGGAGGGGGGGGGGGAGEWMRTFTRTNTTVGGGEDSAVCWAVQFLVEKRGVCFQNWKGSGHNRLAPKWKGLNISQDRGVNELLGGRGEGGGVRKSFFQTERGIGNIIEQESRTRAALK